MSKANDREWLIRNSKGEYHNKDTNKWGARKDATKYPQSEKDNPVWRIPHSCTWEQFEFDKMDDKVSTVLTVGFPTSSNDTNYETRYIIVKAGDLVKSGRGLFQFSALVQGWKLLGRLFGTDDIIDKFEYFICFKLGQGTANNATIEHLLTRGGYEFKFVDKPAKENILTIPTEHEKFSMLGQGVMF